MEVIQKEFADTVIDLSLDQVKYLVELAEKDDSKAISLLAKYNSSLSGKPLESFSFNKILLNLPYYLTSYADYLRKGGTPNFHFEFKDLYHYFHNANAILLGKSVFEQPENVNENYENLTKLSPDCWTILASLQEKDCKALPTLILCSLAKTIPCPRDLEKAAHIWDIFWGYCNDIKVLNGNRYILEIFNTLEGSKISEEQKKLFKKMMVFWNTGPVHYTQLEILCKILGELNHVDIEEVSIGVKVVTLINKGLEEKFTVSYSNFY